MTQVILYLFFALLRVNGQPTGYSFSYSSNQNTHTQEIDNSVPNEDNVNIYKYGG